MKRFILLAVLLLCASPLIPQTISGGGLAISCLSATTTGVCNTFSLAAPNGQLPAAFTWQTITTGTPGGVTVTLEGSIDGTTFTTVDTSSSTSGEIRSVTGKPMRQLRCNVVTFTGGAAPTMTCQFTVTTAGTGGSGGGGPGTVSWDAITNAAANLTLSNGTFTTAFNQTNAATWAWSNTTAATNTVSQSSPAFFWQGQYWNGSASATDFWGVQNIVGNGTNGTSKLTFSHGGSAGTGGQTIGVQVGVGPFLSSAAADIFANGGTTGLRIGTSQGNIANTAYAFGSTTSSSDVRISRYIAGGISVDNGTTLQNRGGFIFAGNSVFVTSNFTTAANTNLQTITGLAWTIPANNIALNFHCHLAYSQATANAAVAFGIQAATAAPTNIFADGMQQVTVGPPATFTAGVLPTLTTTTATNIVSGTPGATATNYIADLHGTIENSSNANTFNIMVSTATSGDAVTVLRGSYCSIAP